MVTCNAQRRVVLGALVLFLSACGTGNQKRVQLDKQYHPTPIRITKVSHQQGSQELLLQSMSLIGRPYRYGGSTRDNGFDCSGMVQYVYQQALQVNLPRTARDIAAVSTPIRMRDLQVGDLVFFNTSGQIYSHIGLYIGNGEFIHAPSSNGVIRTARLDQPYFSQRFTGARTLFAR
ncbi:MAG: C40 family peptidase [Snodgrassella sp.]|uniref:C40 family peptidase n=1 Tax=Snodgrassella sp. TaxID=2815304 RepID=UPI00258EF9A7|nr:C40 family peptidase [Snodgrassella sp.]MCO6517763.1 C40 family peptidase [Snodgrassella sp.]MCO6521064.1 C40 family peptidase [Snodgrassella sp.]MCO6522528.1 C40 family peptidase [Snodgrassella sp.]